MVPAWPWVETQQSAAPLPERWQGGALVAVWPVINVECFVPGRGGPALQPHLAAEPEIANSGWRDYGNTAGAARLARLFSGLGLPATAAVNAAIAARYPAVIETVVAAGWEVIGHGITNSSGHAGLSATQEAERIASALDALHAATGTRPAGWLSPGFSVTPRTPALLAAAGLRFTADRTEGDTPALLHTPTGTIVALPYSLETNDISLCLSARHTAGEFASALIDHVEQLRREAQPGRPLMVALGLHTFIAGQPARALHLGRALESIAAMPGVAFSTGGAICASLSAAPIAASMGGKR